HDSFRSEDLVARLGGDEFGVILPETDEASVLRMTERIQRLVELNNTLHRSPRLSISAGAATGLARGVHLVEVQRQADDRMYQFKRQRKAGKPDQTGNF
ncbi:MAG: GGDEF domain-containing protein, partial [Anaerolineae bacterium]|nr:GGDEF domain-containing protein [Anaerolineae bacterium]